MENLINDWIIFVIVLSFADIVTHLEDYLYGRAGNYAKLSENLMEVMLI
jgi:hypothetical protein